MDKKHRKKHGEKSDHSERAEHHEQPTCDAEGKAQMVYTVKIQPHADEEKRHTEQQTYQKQQVGTAKTLNLFTGISTGIALATLAALIIYACITHGQLNQMSISNRISRESLVSVQRAFVVFYGTVVGTEIPDSTGKRTTTMQLNTPWWNSGNTATKDAVSQVNWVNLPGGMPDNFAYPDQGEVPKNQFALGPKLTGNTTLNVPIDYFESASKRQARLFVYGWFTYRDIFTDTPPRLAEFCDEIINVKSNLPMSDPNSKVTWDLSLCRTHNCYDDQCKDYTDRTSPMPPSPN